MQPHLERLFAHVRWADARVLDLLDTTPEARQPPVLRLVAHLLAAERVWMLRLRGEDSSVQPVWPGETTLEEMRRMAAANAAEYDAFLAGLTDAELAAEVAYTNTQGTAFRTPVGEILLHVALHGAYHRGQIAQLVRAGGAAPVNTDYINFVREGR